MPKNIIDKMKGRIVLFKVLIWDYAGVSSHWLEQVINKKYVEVIGTITTAEPVPEILFKDDAWDWLLIFENGMRNFFDSAIRVSKLPPYKVIYALDINSWLKHYEVALMLINPVAEGQQIFLSINFAFNKLNNFVTCTVEGLHYIATSQDDYVIRYMYTYRINHAANNMKNFQSLTRKYYNVDENSGYFLDLGANIGTSGIYFVKKLAVNLKLLAFEPDAENFKLLRINTILNGLEEKATLVNCGLDNKVDEMTMWRNLQNPGGNSILKDVCNKVPETIQLISLDSYLIENKILPSEVKYIWIDTEGFESQVLLGAKNLIKENPAPIFMECNLKAWNESGLFEDMMALLEEHYSHFIHIQADETIHPIETLRTMEIPNNFLGQIGDIFLIKKGAIE